MDPQQVLPAPDVDTSEKATQILRDWGEIEFVQALLVFLAGLVAIMLVKRLVPWLAERLPDRFRFYVLPWQAILRLVILVLVVIYVTPLIIKPSPENLIAILGGTVLAIGFAFKDYVSSLIAGVVALYERPYRAGDWVKIDDYYGEVKSLTLRTVHMTTPDDDAVFVPHEKIWDTAVCNSNNARRELMCVADFYLHPKHDGLAVRERLKDVAWTSPYLNFRHPVLVIASEKPWGTHYQLKAYPIESRDQFQFITDLTLRGKAVLERLGAQPAVVAALPQMQNPAAN